MHNLGTTKAIVTLLISQNSDGSGFCMANSTTDWDGGGDERRGIYINALTPTTIGIRTGSFTPSARVAMGIDSSGTPVDLNSGYARIIILALE